MGWGNGLSVLAAREAIGNEPFALLMAGHVVDLPLLSELLNEPIEAGSVCSAIDRNLSNPLVDLDDVTKVRATDARLEAIGKDLARYDAFWIDVDDASVAALLLATEAVIGEKPEKKRGAAGVGDMM